MIYVAWIVSLVAVFFLGYYSRSLTSKIEVLEKEVKKKIDKPVEKESPSMLVDVDDPVQTALYEQEQMQKRLNEIR